jgi:hypothetical protein
MGDAVPVTESELAEIEARVRSQIGRIAAHASWAKTPDRTARTANARKALEDTFLAEADGDPLRAESLRKAYYARMAFKSAQARRRRGGGSDAA